MSSILRVFGVDPGLQATGWALVAQEGQRFEARWGLIKPRRSGSVAQRLGELLEGLSTAIQSQRPHVVAVERPFVKEDVRAAMALGQAQAAAFIAAARLGLEVAEYAPREIKHRVAGDGGAEKAAMAQLLYMELALPELPEPSDAADALAVAYCHLLSQRLAVTAAPQP